MLTSSLVYVQDCYDRFLRFLGTDYDWLAEQLYSQSVSQADMDTFTARHLGSSSGKIGIAAVSRDNAVSLQESPALARRSGDSGSMPGVTSAGPDSCTMTAVHHRQRSEPLPQTEDKHPDDRLHLAHRNPSHQATVGGSEVNRKQTDPVMISGPEIGVSRTQQSGAGSNPVRSEYGSSPCSSVTLGLNPVSSSPAKHHSETGYVANGLLLDPSPANSWGAGSQSPWQQYLSGRTSSSSSSLHPPCSSWRGSSSPSAGKRLAASSYCIFGCF